MARFLPWPEAALQSCKRLTLPSLCTIDPYNIRVQYTPQLHRVCDHSGCSVRQKVVALVVPCHAPCLATHAIR